MSRYPEIDAVLAGESEGCIVHGDCLEVMAEMPDGGIDALVTDPPYGTEELGGGYGRRQNHDPEGRCGRKIANDVDQSAIENAMSLISVVALNAWCVIFCAPRKRYEATNVLVDAGLVPFGELIWDKARPGLGYTIRYSHETAMVLKRGEPERHAIALSVIRVPAHGTPIHPHAKPVELMKPIVDFASGVGEVVFDPFCGIGSTCEAAKRLGRRYIGIEINERWAEIARARIRDTEKPLFT